ncbi:MAG TPA: hypothetical protein VF972_08810, partial [Actinomycetota bacterium]
MAVLVLLAGAPARAASDLPVGWSPGPAMPAGFDPQWDMASAYFPPLDEVVVFGGSPKAAGETWSNQTWVFANGSWSQGPSAPAGLTPRGGAAMAYDPAIDKIVLFGGAGDAWPPFNDTWLFDGTKWSAGPSAPAALTGRSGAEMAYLHDTNQMVLFGGSGVVPENQTWIFDGTTWAAGPSTPSSISARVFFGMTYVPEQHALYVAGGDGNTDGWYFDGTSWTPGPSLDPLGPKERLRMVFDPQLDAVVTFGGYGPGDATNDFWMMRSGTWSQILYWSGAGWPDPRADAGMVWLPTQDALMMFSGNAVGDGSVVLSDSWYFRDVAPQISSLAITPSAPSPGDGLVLSIGDSVGGYPAVTKQIEWYVDGVLNPDTDNRLNVGNYQAGDKVYARIQEADALGLVGPWVSSQTVDIGDRPPSILSVSLAPSKAYVTSTLTATANNVTDPDGDAVTLHYVWTVNGQNLTGNDASTLTPDQFKAGDVVHVTVTGVDPWGASSAPVTSVDRTINWNIVPRQSVAPGKSVTTNGGGYTPGETVNFKLDSPTAPTAASVVTDSTGSWVGGMQLPVPSSYVGGVHPIYGVGATSGIVGQGQLTVVSMITVTPGSLGFGDAATVNGVGFGANEPVSVSFGGSSTTIPVTADANGSFVLSTTSPDIALGNGVITATAASGSDSATFTVLSRLASPATAKPGDTVTVQVHGFSPVETVYVKLDTSSTVVAALTTDANGYGQAQVTLNLLFGKHTINV